MAERGRALRREAMAGVGLLDPLPRLGWVEAATPVTEAGGLARELGLGWLGIKRDDLLPALHGGTKPRKLDYLLAASPWAEAWGWQSLGALGSGHLLACAAAAERLGRKLVAHVFWEPLSQTVLENLACLASGPVTLRYYPSRLAVGLRRPGLLALPGWEALPVIPPGGTTPPGMLGTVRAGLELGGQIRAGELPEPERIYLALGTGGTAVGLSVGLALAGVRTRIHGVSTVEWPVNHPAALGRLTRALLAHLAQAGVPARCAPVPVEIDRRHLGGRYGVETAAGLMALARVQDAGVKLEAIYTAKAAAALFADAARGGFSRALLWNTAHQAPVPHHAHWRARLPEALARRLERNAPG